MAHSRLFQPPRRMSAFRSKADSFSCSPICPLMTLSGHVARIRANAIQPRQTELRNHRPDQVNADENAFWVVVCARSRFLNDVPSVLERQQYASAPWKFFVTGVLFFKCRFSSLWRQSVSCKMCWSGLWRTVLLEWRRRWLRPRRWARWWSWRLWYACDRHL
jgi:hypothetical protein